jgi:hypothetical protein
MYDTIGFPTDIEISLKQMTTRVFLSEKQVLVVKQETTKQG